MIKFLCLNGFVAILAYKKQMLTSVGVCAAFFLGCYVIYNSTIAYVLLLFFFLGENVLERVVLPKKMHEERTTAQVVCNSFVACMILLLMINAPNSEKYCYMYVVVLASSMSDSVASTIGTRYAKKVYSICRLKPVNKGISGGISLCGTIGGILGSTYIVGIYELLMLFSGHRILWGDVVRLILCGVAGMIIDSILGDLFQKKYYCSICKRLSDNEMCCKAKPAQLISGFLSNNGVNLLSNIFLFVMLMVLW